jgi:hypothetical protein
MPAPPAHRGGRLEVAARSSAAGGAGASKELVFTPARASTVLSGRSCDRPPTSARPRSSCARRRGDGRLVGRQHLVERLVPRPGYLTFSIDYRLVDPATDHGIYPIPEQNTKAAVQPADARRGARHRPHRGAGPLAGARLGGILATTADLPAFSGREVWPDVSDRSRVHRVLRLHDGIQYQPVAYYGGTGVPPSTAVSNRRVARSAGPSTCCTARTTASSGHRTRTSPTPLHATGPTWCSSSSPVPTTATTATAPPPSPRSVWRRPPGRQLARAQDLISRASGPRRGWVVSGHGRRPSRTWAEPGPNRGRTDNVAWCCSTA